jgi:aminomethyltransferase
MIPLASSDPGVWPVREVFMSKPSPEGMKRTPLYPLYARYGAKVVDFHGWELPVQYAGIIDEHQAVRTHAGLFDISHMGEIEISGAGSLAFVQYLTINDASVLEDGQVQYSAMCFPDGGIVDDITLYRFSPERYLLCVNASNTSKDLDWIEKHRPQGVTVRDLSRDTALLALQGPKAEFILRPMAEVSIAALPYYRFTEGKVGGVEAVISRTGYTGEDGFEFFVPAGAAAELWQKIMAAGTTLGLKPVGLGARDTLRMEMKYALYGNDIGPDTDPVEAGLGWITKSGKGSFVGREAVVKRLESGPGRKLIAFEITTRGIARPGCAIVAGGSQVGTVTSGTFSPSLRKGIGLGYVPVGLSRPGTSLAIEVRGTKLQAEVVRPPFYKKGSVRK